MRELSIPRRNTGIDNDQRNGVRALRLLQRICETQGQALEGKQLAAANVIYNRLALVAKKHYPEVYDDFEFGGRSLFTNEMRGSY